MVDFNKIISKVLENEGGYDNDPKDPGGETKYGISKKTYPNLNIKDLTKDEAIEIYRKDWYKKWDMDVISSERIAYKVLDAIINIGPGRFNIVLGGIGLPRMEINSKESRIKVFQELNYWLLTNTKEKEDIAIKQIKVNLEKFYTNLTITHPKLKVYLHGWLKRAYREL